MFDMHENADIARELKETKSLIDNITLVYGNQLRNENSATANAPSETRENSRGSGQDMVGDLGGETRLEAVKEATEAEDPDIAMCTSLVHKVMFSF